MTHYERIVALNTRDLLSAFKLSGSNRLWNRLARFPAQRFAKELLAFDETVERQGFIEGGRQFLKSFARSVTVIGAGNIPRLGPLLIASNHPGMIDAMALWVAINREDLMIIGADRDLLRLLPNTCAHLILIEKNSLTAFRKAEAHLKSGGALLTFPAGRIEPDVTVHQGACESLASWSHSVAALKRRVPETELLPAFVRGVISAKAVNNPFLRYLKDQKERDWAGATLQIVCPAYRKVDAKVDFGAPTDCFEGVIAQMREFIHRSESVV